MYLRSGWKKTWLAAILFALAAAAVPTWADEHELPVVEPFKLRTVTGMEYDFAARKGTPLTIVSFFATWNPRSEVILKELEKLKANETLKGKGFDVLAINAETENPPPEFDAQLSAYLKNAGITITVLKDPTLTVFRAFGVKAMPTTFLFDKELKVEKVITGASSAIHDELLEAAQVAMGLTPDNAAANAAPTRYQASRNEMLNYGLADVLLQRGNHHKAAEKIEQVIAGDLKFPDAFALKGVIMLSISEEGETAKNAKDAFAKALELDPNLPLALFGSAYFSAVDGDTKSALEKTRAALGKTAWGFTKTPDKEKLAAYIAHLDKADQLFAQGNAPEATNELSVVLEDFVVVRKRVRVDQKRMRELKERSEGTSAPAK